MMDEIKQVHASINPVETLFVVGRHDRSGCGQYGKKHSMKRYRLPA